MSAWVESFHKRTVRKLPNLTVLPSAVRGRT